MKYYLPLVVWFVMTLQNGMAQNPTFSENVAAILYQNCTPCHRTGGIGPFALEGYTDAVNNSAAIRLAVSSGTMPPWPPDTTYRRFSHERVLSQEQQQEIIAWVDQNMPQGNPALEPPLPVFNTNSQLSQVPSATYQIPTYTITSNHDDYRAFVLPNLSTTTQAVTELEFMPANRSIVHHILVYYDTSGICQQLDNADPLPGYVAFGGIGNGNAKQIGGWVPGAPALRLPANFGMPAYKNGKYVIQIHYAPGSAGLKDSTSFSVVYKPITPIMREVYQVPILNHYSNMTNGPLQILPNERKKFIESQGMPIPISVLGITPHMHLIGRDAKVYGLRPGNPDTLKIVRIKDWNFNWQGQYMFRKLMVVPMGTVLRSESVYDNTDANPFNPSNPPVTVTAGEATTNEMMLTYFMFVLNQPGDENIVLDSLPLVTSTKTLENTEDEWFIYPSPAKNDLYVGFRHMQSSLEPASIQITDAMGKKVIESSLMHGSSPLPGTFRISLSGLPSGIYRAIVHQKGKVSKIGFVKE